MQISLEIVNPKDNTNTPHGTVTLSTDNKYVYIETDKEKIAVGANDLYIAVIALFR